MRLLKSTHANILPNVEVDPVTGECPLLLAGIFYRLPNHPKLLHSHIWHDYDPTPRFPKLVHFLEFWYANLDDPLYRMRVAHRKLISPTEFRFVEGELRLQ